MQCRLRFLIGLIVCLTLVAPLDATSVRIVNLEEMVQLSDRVFRGRCLSALEVEGVGGFDAMEYIFEISEGVKGTRTGERVVFRQVVASRQGKKGIPGMPAYQEGQDLLIFLHGNSKLGLTSPVGFTQGVFKVVDGDAEGPRVINGVNNRNLMVGEVSAASALGLNSGEVSELTQTGDLPLRTLTAAIRKIDRFQAANGRSAQ